MISKSKMSEIIYEFISCSNKKMSLYEISKMTLLKTNDVYIALTKNKKIKNKKINNTIYWYIDDKQKDPIAKKDNTIKIDELFEEILNFKGSSKRKMRISI